MKILKRALSAALAEVMLFAGGSVCVAAKDCEQQGAEEFTPAENNNTFVMYKDGDYYRFSGVTGDRSNSQSADASADALCEV